MASERFDQNDALGADLRGPFDLDSTLSLCSGIECVRNDCVRRLNTPRGSLFWARDEGLDLGRYLNGTLDGAAPSLAGAIRNELMKDDRVSDSSATVDYNPLDESLTIGIAVTVSTGDTFDIIGRLDKGFTPTFVQAGT